MTDTFRREPPRQDLAQGIADMVGVWQQTALAAADIAHARRTIFQAYVAEGFSEAQALELIKSL